jgi:hypothetical protein
MMRRRKCHVCDFSSLRNRRASVFFVIRQLELIADAEEILKYSLRDDLLGFGRFDDANRRISLIDTAIDALLAIYPSLYGGEPF